MKLLNYWKQYIRRFSFPMAGFFVVVFLSALLYVSVYASNELFIDSDLLPATSDTYKLGNTGTWEAVNDTLAFNGNNVTFDNRNTPGVLDSGVLVVEGGVRLNTTFPKPVCDALNPGTRGTFWVTLSGTSTRDRVEVCVRDGLGVIGWQNILK